MSGPWESCTTSWPRGRSASPLRRRRRWWRKAARGEQATTAELGDPAPEPPPHEAAVQGWPLHRQVHAALATLPEEQRRVVLLAYFEGLTHSEIARRTGQPLGTVKTRLRIAQQKLAEALQHLKDWME